MNDSAPGHGAGAPNPDAPDLVSTRLISRRLEVDGVEFHWWAVGEKPALVTVRSKLFGGRTRFSMEDPAEFARQLAEAVLDDHYARKPAVSAAPEPRMPGPAEPSPADGDEPSIHDKAGHRGAQGADATSVDAFSKPGWFRRP